MVTWRIRASRASSPVEMVSASTLVTRGTDKFCKVCVLQILGQALLRGHHQRGVEGGGDRQNYGAFCAELGGDFDGAFYGGGVAGDYCLLGRIEIGGGANFAIVARLQASATTAGERPMMAAMAPTPAGTASCM